MHNVYNDSGSPTWPHSLSLTFTDAENMHDSVQTNLMIREKSHSKKKKKKEIEQDSDK